MKSMKWMYEPRPSGCVPVQERFAHKQGRCCSMMELVQKDDSFNHVHFSFVVSDGWNMFAFGCPGFFLSFKQFPFFQQFPVQEIIQKSPDHCNHPQYNKFLSTW